MEEAFWWAAFAGKVTEVEEILRDNPTIDVNWRNPSWGVPALFIACEYRHDSIASLLLAHPGVDANPRNYDGSTPFMRVCYNGRPSCARLLLRDSRVDVNEQSSDGFTPLYWASFRGMLDVIRWWIMSGREMNLGEPGNEMTDAIGVANNPVMLAMEFPKEFEERTARCAKVASLLEQYKENPVKTRHEVRAEMGWYDQLAAGMFALVVFVSDGLLVPSPRRESPAARYFGLVSQLPIELQMVLCFRAVGSAKELIPRRESEVAFKELAKRLL